MNFSLENSSYSDMIIKLEPDSIYNITNTSSISESISSMILDTIFDSMVISIKPDSITYSDNTMNETINNSTNTTSGNTGCELLGNFGFIIQGILGVLSFAVLFYKRFSENPKRTWKVWFFDSSKQLSSAGLAHVLNVIIAIFLSKKSDNGDSCVWYFINIFIDSTMGMLICYILITILNMLAEKNNWRVIF